MSEEAEVPRLLSQISTRELSTLLLSRSKCGFVMLVGEPEETVARLNGHVAPTCAFDIKARTEEDSWLLSGMMQGCWKQGMVSRGYRPPPK